MDITYEVDKKSFQSALASEAHTVLANGVTIGTLMRARTADQNGWFFYYCIEGESKLIWVDGPNPTYSAKEACRAIVMGHRTPEDLLLKRLLLLDKTFTVADFMLLAEKIGVTWSQREQLLDAIAAGLSDS